MKNVAHYQSESQTMNTTTCLILITATLLAAAKGFEAGSFDNNYYYEEPAPTSKVILVSCDTVVTLNIASKIVQGGNFYHYYHCHRSFQKYALIPYIISC